MKTQLVAAAAIAFTLGPGALFALQSTNAAVVYDYNSTADVILGLTSGWQAEKLRHRDWTLHKLVDNPDLVPAGACRDVANQWNGNILGYKSILSFHDLIGASANNRCKLQYTKSGSINADGTFDLIAVAPTP